MTAREGVAPTWTTSGPRRSGRRCSGKLTGDLVVDATPPAEPVPDWLADRLVHTVGLAREEVAALTLEQAVDRWTAYVSEPKR